MPRKTTGCWTCRARKKKCTDGRPSCAECNLRALTCYGYGSKPGWMDGGDREKRMLCTMKLLVKESYSQRRRSRASQASRRESLSSVVMPLSPGSRTGHLGGSPPYSGDQQHASHLIGDLTSSDEADPHGMPAAYSTKTIRHRSRSPESRAVATLLYSEAEICLLMYYFDHIFPRLCPFFTYYAGDSGRGWLLSLFLRTKPLCAAAVCISACDQAQFVLGPLSDIPQPNHDLEMKHIQSVADLRAHLTQLSLKTGASRMAVAVEALACIMHLVLFELWIPRQGIMNDWVMHLDAASALLSSVDSTMIETSPGHSPVSVSSETMAACHDVLRIFTGVEFLSDCEKLAFDYFLTQYTYCFIISAVGRELTPQSMESVERTREIFHKDQSKLKDMFGCEDWVLIAMLDIAVLKEWKQRERYAGTLSLRELTRRADEIEKQLSDGLNEIESTETEALPRSNRDEKIRMITAIYLNAALLFLHIVVSGFYPNLPEIRRAVLQTLEALEYMREHSDMNFPSWPFCVAGCLALETEYPRFRALSPPPKVGHHPLVLTQWTLNIIERCWHLRSTQAKTEETFDWVAVMNDLGTRLLLL